MGTDWKAPDAFDPRAHERSSWFQRLRDNARPRPLAALPGGVTITFVKFFITGGAKVALFKLFHQSGFLQGTALVWIFFSHCLYLLQIFRRITDRFSRPIGRSYASAAFVRRMVTRVVDVAVCIHNEAAAKVRMSLVIGFTHTAFSFVVIGFVHGVASMSIELE